MTDLLRFPDGVRGKTYRHRFKFSGISGSIGSSKIRLMVKFRDSDRDSAALVRIDNDLLGGIAIVTATSPYEIDITITDNVMAKLPPQDLSIGIHLEMPDGTTAPVEKLDPKWTVQPHAVHVVGLP